MKKLLKIISLFLCLCFAFPLGGCGSKKFVVGTKDFTEQIVLGYLYAELIRANTDYDVSVKSDMASNVVFNAVNRGDVSMYIDYTGTLYSTVLNHADIKSTEEVYDITKAEMKQNYNLEVLDPLGYNNTYTLSVRKDTAEQYNLRTYSDLAAVADQLVLGSTMEFLNRQDGFIGLKEAYNISAFKNEVALEGSLRYSALQSDQIQVTDAFSTDGLLKEYDLIVLEDDRNFFPPYWAVPVVRPDALEQYPDVLALIEQMAGSLDEATMIDLNYQVDVEKKNPKDVAIAYLESKDLL